PAPKGRIPAQPGGPPRTPATSRASLTDVVPRRTLVIVAVIVALAVLGVVLGLTLGGDDKGEGAEGGSDRTASAGATGSGSSADTGKDKGQDKGKETGKGEDKGSGGDEKDPDENKGSAAPGQGASPSSDGSGADVSATPYKHSQGFSIDLPKGWKYTSTSAAGARFTGPDGQKLLVGWTSSPKSDPVADWRSQERYMHRAQYDRVRIAGVDYRGWNTADWEFTYVDGGTKYHAIDRGFVVNSSLGYGLMYTAKDAGWNGAQRKSTWQTFAQSFKPKS
ncbi:serine/threonine protein kinase, partial [Streptomyces sp. SID14478]|nr:serine/threonine protein kinase [Streptomyces sp. SID14478]